MARPPLLPIGAMLALSLAAMGEAAAQTAAPAPAAPQSRPAPRPAPAPAPPAEPQPEPPPPVYERDLMRLSELMGSLAFLSELCSEPDAAQWRQRMQTLIDTEGGSPARRERLAGAFNKGYRGFAVVYGRCTESARAAIDLYLAEGAALSRTITNRYGG